MPSKPRPVAGCPRHSPCWVPEHLKWPTTFSGSAITSTTSMWKSGNDSRNGAIQRRAPSANEPPATSSRSDRSPSLTISTKRRTSARLCSGSVKLLGGLDQSDQMALRVLEVAQHDPHAGNLVGAHYARAAEALGLGEPCVDVGHLDVEHDVSLVPVGPSGNAAADAGAVGVRVAVALDDSVAHRVVRVDLPAEQLRVVVDQLLPV